MRLGLVLSGGGAKGSFEAGVLAAIEEAGLRPDIVTGTSAGALNAAALAAGFDADRLAGLWTSLDDGDVFRLRRDVWRLPRLRGLLERGNLAGRLLAKIGWTWFLDAAPLRRTLVSALGGERVPVRDGVFRPGRVANQDFWDGGIVANTPLASALAYEPDTVIVVTTATRERPAAPPDHLGGALSLLIDNLLRHSLLNDLARAEALNALARAAPQATTARVVTFLVVEPAGLDLGEGLRFDRRQAARNIALGREVGQRALADWRQSGQLA